ncbi:holin family protein [Celeribacter marinus]|uniref:holin family protein n=1 Tax=Celeribacter marinus TaxID=1397108 RepID=UPI003F6CA41D
MGIIDKLLGVLFGEGRNVVRETAEIFLENRENSGARDAEFRSSALEQFAREFALERKGGFDRFMDGLNRVPRPLMAFGTIGLCVAAMVDPVWFAARMQGIALVPEPLWWLFGAIVSFYFGARYQVKSQDFQRSVVATMAQAPVVTANIAALNALAAGSRGLPPASAGSEQDNPALMAWRQADDE